MSQGVEIMCKCNRQDQVSLSRFFSKCSLAACLTIMQRHRTTLHMLLSQYRNVYELEEISYSALILAIRSAKSEEEKLLKDDFKNMTLDEIRDISIRRANYFFEGKLKRQKPKRDKLIGYWGTIKTLRENGASFRDISVYLKSYNRFEVGHTTIYELWKELEKASMEEER